MTTKYSDTLYIDTVHNKKGFLAAGVPDNIHTYKAAIDMKQFLYVTSPEYQKTQKKYTKIKRKNITPIRDEDEIKETEEETLFIQQQAHNNKKPRQSVYTHPDDPRYSDEEEENTKDIPEAIALQTGLNINPVIHSPDSISVQKKISPTPTTSKMKDTEQQEHITTHPTHPTPQTPISIKSTKSTTLAQTNTPILSDRSTLSNNTSNAPSIPDVHLIQEARTQQILNFTPDEQANTAEYIPSTRTSRSVLPLPSITETHLNTNNSNTQDLAQADDNKEDDDSKQPELPPVITPQGPPDFIEPNDDEL